MEQHGTPHLGTAKDDHSSVTHPRKRAAKQTEAEVVVETHHGIMKISTDAYTFAVDLCDVANARDLCVCVCVHF